MLRRKGLGSLKGLEGLVYLLVRWVGTTGSGERFGLACEGEVGLPVG